MDARELIVGPDADRKQLVYEASDVLLGQALTLAQQMGAAYAASDIAYEMGRRVGEES